MDMTIGRMKIGAPLIMGKYGVNNDTPQPILWLKGTPNGDFITKDAVDFLPFDARERNNQDDRNARNFGNCRYAFSNILQFLNSADESWYNRAHPSDAPPERGNVDWNWMQYDQHYGFLYHFEEYEVAALATDVRVVNGNEVVSLIRLPSLSEVIGNERFQLFRKKGVRPNATEDLLASRRGMDFDHGSYLSFWVTDVSRYDGYASAISRNGILDSKYPKECSGVRPVCMLPLDTLIIQGDDGLFHIKPTLVTPNTFTDEELFALLGLAQP